MIRAGVMGLSSEPGWLGVFTRNEAEGAIPNGTRVFKNQTDTGDAHGIGTMATVLGSISSCGILFYFVEWDDMPKVAVGVMPQKIAQWFGN